MSKYLGCGVLFLVFVAGAVKADELNSSIVAKPYLGVGAGISYSNDLYNNAKDVFSNTGLVDDDSIPLAPVANIYMGAEIGKNIEVRVGYLYLGMYDVDIISTAGREATISMTWTAWTADLLYKVPTANEGVSFFGKLGVASTRMDGKVSGVINDSGTDTKTTFVPGVGVKNDFSERAGFAVELDYYPKLAGSGDGETYTMLTFTGNLYFRF